MPSQTMNIILAVVLIVLVAVLIMAGTIGLGQGAGDPGSTGFYDQIRGIVR